MIREANKNDVVFINELGKCLNANFSHTYDINNYITSDNYIVLVNVDEVINGFILIFKNIDNYEIEAIVVDENYRRKGIGKSLIEYFFNNYLKKGDTILLEVSENNDKAIKLYTKYGFEQINKRKKYYNDIDALIMKKVI